MRMPSPTQLLALALAAAALAPATASAAEPPVSEQIIVRYRAGTDAAERADTRAAAETVHEDAMRLPNAEVVAVTEGTRADALAELRADPDVVWAEPNQLVQPATSDPGWTYLWGMFNDGSGGMRVDADIDALQAWTVSQGAGITVGVVDTGVQSAHPDLTGRLVTGYNAMDGTTETTDALGHGTHVAGIIAANSDNGIGVAGIAPQATIQPIKVFPPSGLAALSDVANAFDYAGSHGLPVVNASLGAYGTSAAIDLAMSSHPNTLYVISAGNGDNQGGPGTDNDLDPTTPCVSNAPNVLCVGATTSTDSKASYSNYGAGTVDLFAPGSSILSTVPTSAYQYMSGTSMAAPYAAGVAALVAAHLGLRGSALAQRLKATVDPVAALAGKSVTGGRLNAARAVGATVDPPSQPVIASATGGVNTATITMASRETDVSSYLVYEGGSLLKTSSSPTIVLGDLAAGSHTFTVVAQNTSSHSSPASGSASVAVTDPAPVTPTPQPTPPPTERPGTITIPAPTPSVVTDVTLVKRGGRTSLVFRVNRTARITVALSRLQGSTYRQTASRSVQMAAGLQSLPVTSRLLGMRVPRGRWRVTVGTAAHTASVAFTRR
jgi:thermitase